MSGSWGSLVWIVRVTSDEAENGEDDGNTTDDVVVGAGCRSADLRAERQETGDGRAYTLHLAVSDGRRVRRDEKAHGAPVTRNQGPIDAGRGA